MWHWAELKYGKHCCMDNYADFRLQYRGEIYFLIFGENAKKKKQTWILDFFCYHCRFICRIANWIVNIKITLLSSLCNVSSMPTQCHLGLVSRNNKSLMKILQLFCNILVLENRCSICVHYLITILNVVWMISQIFHILFRYRPLSSIIQTYFNVVSN